MAVAETPTANVDKAAIKARNFIVSRNMKLLGNCEGRRGAGVDCLQCLPLLYTTDTDRQLYFDASGPSTEPHNSGHE